MNKEDVVFEKEHCASEVHSLLHKAADINAPRAGEIRDLGITGAAKVS